MKKEVEGFQIRGTLYDRMKFAVQIIIPALSTLYFTLGTIWDWPNIDKVVGTLAALATFLGVLVGLSAKNYKDAGSMYDGTVTVIPNEEGTALKLNIDPEDLIGKKELLLKLSGNPLPEDL